MNEKQSIWIVLGIDQTTDVAVIRRAYAKRLKQDRPDDAQSFQLLRSAYEMALGYAQQQMHNQRVTDANESVPATTVSQKPEATTEASRASDKILELAPVVLPVDELSEQLNALGLLFQQLHQSLKSQDIQVARKYFDEILGSSALERIDVERRVEYELANLLASTLPASDALLEISIKRFGWDSLNIPLSRTPTISAILSRISDLQFLEQLRSGNNNFSLAYSKLCIKATGLMRWVKYYGLGSTLDVHELIMHIRNQHPSLIAEFDPMMVEWYEDFVTEPQPSFLLIVLSIILSFAVIPTILSVAQARHESPLIAVLYIGGYFLSATAIVLAKLFLLDWPRHKVQKKWPKGSPPVFRFGWVVVLCMALLLASVSQVSPVAKLLVIPTFVIAILWMVIVNKYVTATSAPTSDVNFIFLMASNIPLVFWLVALFDEATNNSMRVLLWTIIAVLLTTISWPNVAIHFFLKEVSSKLRKWYISLIIMLAVSIASLTWVTCVRSIWQPVCIALTIILVMLYRPIGFLLSKRQQQIRFGWLFAGYWIAVANLDSDALTVRNAVVTSGALLFCSTVIVAMFMAFWNEHRNRAVLLHQS